MRTRDAPAREQSRCPRKVYGRLTALSIASACTPFASFQQPAPRQACLPPSCECRGGQGPTMQAAGPSRRRRHPGAPGHTRSLGLRAMLRHDPAALDQARHADVLLTPRDAAPRFDPTPHLTPARGTARTLHRPSHEQTTRLPSTTMYTQWDDAGGHMRRMPSSYILGRLSMAIPERSP